MHKHLNRIDNDNYNNLSKYMLTELSSELFSAYNDLLSHTDIPKLIYILQI